jgi:hypothetical protein
MSGKTKAPARGYLWALFFDDQGMSQGGAALSTEISKPIQGLLPELGLQVARLALGGFQSGFLDSPGGF